MNQRQNSMMTLPTSVLANHFKGMSVNQSQQLPMIQRPGAMRFSILGLNKDLVAFRNKPNIISKSLQQNDFKKLKDSAGLSR